MENIKNKLNIGISLGLLLLIILGGLIWADTNDIWYNAKDIRGGTFGFDEQPINNFTFINPIYIINGNNLTVNGYVTIQNDSVSTDNQTITKFYVDSTIISGSMSEIINCNSQGLFYNGSTCIYGTGVDITPTSFSFTNFTGAEFNIFTYSNEITLSGFGTNLFFELKNNDTKTSIIKNGIDTNLTRISVIVSDKIKLKLLSKNDFELNSSVDYILGSLSSSWRVKTKPDVIITYSKTTCEKYLNGVLSSESCTQTGHIKFNSGHFCCYEGRSACSMRYKSKFVHADGTIIWSPEKAGGYGNWPSECTNWGNTHYSPTWTGNDANCITSIGENCSSQ